MTRLMQAWVSAALAVLPEFLILPGLRKRWTKTLAVGQLSDIESADIQSGDVCDLDLSDDLVLQRTIKLPKTVKPKNVQEAIRLDLLKSSPHAPDDLLWSYQPAADGTGYRQYVLKKPIADAILEAVRKKGAIVRHVFAAAAPQAVLIDHSLQADRAIRRWFLGAGFAAIAAAVAFLYSYHAQTAALATVLEKQREANETAFEELAEAGGDSGAFLEEITHRAEQSKGRLAVLQDVTNALGAETWVPRMRFVGGTAEIAVVSRRAQPEIIRALETMPTIRAASPTSPAAFDRSTGLNRFDLSLSLGN